MIRLIDRLAQVASQIYRDVYRGRRGAKYYLSILKFCFRGLCLGSMTADWFSILDQKQLAPLVGAHPRVFGKLQRPYLARPLDKSAQLAALRQHYQFMLERFTGPALEEIFASSHGLLIAQFPVREVGILSLRLLYNGRYEKEGELTIVLRKDDPGEALFNLTFCVVSNQPDHRQIIVGGLQGSKASQDKDLVIGITRGMHGIRPKAFLLWVVQELARDWNVNSLRAVSDAACVSQLYARSTEIRASYNVFWEESQGHFEPDGFYTLPTAPQPRDLLEMKASKRQMYQRRYRMLADLAVQISARMEGYCATAAPRPGAGLNSNLARTSIA